MNRVCRSLILGIGLSGIAGCGLWSAPDAREPQALVEFAAEKQLVRQWSMNIGSGFGDLYHQSRPAVTETGIYIADASGQVSSIDLESGKLNWRTDLDAKLSASAGAGFGVVAVTLMSGELVALSAEAGQELWRVQLPSEVLAQPQINSSQVVVQTISGQVIALSRQSGDQLWVYDAQEPALTLRGTGTPLLLRDGVLAGFANGKVVALSLESGTPVWEVRVSESNGRSDLERLIDLDGRFLVAGDLVYTGGYQGRLVAINPAAATTVWTRDFSTYRSLAAGFGNVYAADASGAIEAFDSASAASVWRNDMFSFRQLGSPVTLGNDLVFGDAYGYLHVLSQTDGHMVARYKVDNSAIFAEPVVVNDTLLVLSNAGKLEALRLK